MKLFQYEREDCSVSIIHAEDKEEALDLLKEFDKDINPDNISPLRNFLINLSPDIKQGNICWGLDDMGYKTILELPILDPIEDECIEQNDVLCKVIEFSDFLQ